jgi:hypothetical protein
MQQRRVNAANVISDLIKGLIIVFRPSVQDETATAFYFHGISVADRGKVVAQGCVKVAKLEFTSRFLLLHNVDHITFGLAMTLVGVDNEHLAPFVHSLHATARPIAC